MTLDDLADIVNRMKPGERYGLDYRDMRSRTFSYNTFLYSDWKHALRGKVTGSNFGTLVIRETGPYTVTLEKHEEGERLYDRDGYPIRAAAQ